ncbi:MAG: M20/M25/M40 family metallo-hydrolase, partial [Sphaerochaetaceae bacterium]|nr:M20/M25/M40 family metallo-hydrolase [Sphaerochaetaceae bacterium]
MNTFDYFYEICKIPRDSGNEEGVRQFLLSWAKEQGFEASRDKGGNIFIWCPPTPGYENLPYVALQGHMDMVCVKVPESHHNFLTDPIETYVDGDWIKAKGTSLGGDNGIAIAMVMALFTDKEAKHGPLEAIFTYSEETGLDGAFALDGSMIKSKMLINLDSEDDNIIFIGCAGGTDFKANTKVSLEEIPNNFMG